MWRNSISETIPVVQTSFKPKYIYLLVSTFMKMEKISQILVKDVRFPTSLKHHGSDAMVRVCFNDICKAVAILPSMAIYPQRLFCRELFVIGQS